MTETIFAVVADRSLTRDDLAVFLTLGDDLGKPVPWLRVAEASGCDLAEVANAIARLAARGYVSPHLRAPRPMTDHDRKILSILKAAGRRGEPAVNVIAQRAGCSLNDAIDSLRNLMGLDLVTIGRFDREPTFVAMEPCLDRPRLTDEGPASAMELN